MARIYDLVMTHQLDADDFFIHRVQQHCAEAGLNFFLIEPLWVDRFMAALQRDELWARVLLNMHSEHHRPDDIFHQLVRLASERNVRVIDSLEVALAAFDKARAHRRLAAADIPVPPTIIVPWAQVDGFQLSEGDLAMLGRPFVIKPSMGYGRRGVVLDATSAADLARSVVAWPDDAHYLLQRRVVPRTIQNEPAYFRVFYVFGAVWCCWWNCYTDRYRLVNAAEAAEWRLAPLEAIVRGIAELTGMNFFSSEIALNDAGEFVVIDYVNDQCHMLSQSAHPQIGVPDEVVAAIARQLVDSARKIIAREWEGNMRDPLSHYHP